MDTVNDKIYAREKFCGLCIWFYHNVGKVFVVLSFARIKTKFLYLLVGKTWRFIENPQKP